VLSHWADWNETQRASVSPPLILSRRLIAKC
jgi:hypothetical protein